MKKLLSILAAVGLTATASTAVVACGSSKKESASKEITGSKTVVDKTVDVKDNVFTIEMTIPKGWAFDVDDKDNGNIDITGLYGKDKKSITLLAMVKTSDAKEGKTWDVSDDSKDNGYKDAHVDVEFSAKETDLEGKLNKDNTLKENTKLTVTGEFLNDSKVTNDSKLSIILENDSETSASVYANLFNLSFNVIK